MQPVSRSWGVLGGLLALNALLLLLPINRRAEPSGPAHARVGLVFDVGGRGDKSFNDRAFEGVERAVRELGIAAQYVEPGEGADREAGIRLLASQGFDLVIGVGFIFSDDMYALAHEYPKTRFACIDYAKFDEHGLVVPPANMVALKFREEEGAFLVGALAALVSKTQAVGFVGGMDIPLIHKFEAGYKAGVAAVCAGCRVLVGYAGVTGDAFKNPAKGKELALSQYGAGADVIFHASGSTGLGVFEAARSQGKLAIGVDADQWGEAPGHVLTSMIKRVDVVVLDTIRRVLEQRFEGGLQVFGLAEGALSWVDDEHNRAFVSDAARTRVQALRADIVAGRIRPPSTRGTP